MKHTTKHSARAPGFSIMETLLVVAVVAVMAGVATLGLTKIRGGSSVTKLRADVSTVNHVIKVYLASGGDLTGVTEPQAVLDKLKTRLSGADAAQFAGLEGAMIDKRLSTEMQTSSEAATGALRAVWNVGKRQFEIKSFGDNGVARFEIDDALAKIDFGEESRDGFGKLNAGDGWIWAYQDSPDSRPLPSPTFIPLVPVSATPPTTTPPTQPGRLAAPTVAPPGGTLPITDYPKVVTVDNPNDPAVSELYWATVWSGSGGVAWIPYTEPVYVLPGQQLLAYAKSTAPDYFDSYSAGEFYDMTPFQLLSPTINSTLSSLDLTANSPSEISLSDPNPPVAQREVQFKLPGGDWTAYDGAFSVSPAAFGSTGFTMEARVIGVPADSRYFLESPTVSETLQIKLRTPGLQLSAPAFTEQTPIITVTMSDTNPAGSSNPTYKILNIATGQDSGWQTYSTPLELLGSSYPSGFQVTAFAAPASSAFLASDETAASANSFFGVGVDGATIFVLDTSGSMNWNNRLENVKTSMTNLIGNLTPNERFAIIEFNGSATVVADWANASPPEQAAAVAAVEALNATGPTNYEAALAEALSIITAENGEVSQVIFLSDGHPTQGQTSPPALIGLAANIAAAGVSLDVIGFQIGQRSQELLQNLAAAGNGTFTEY